MIELLETEIRVAENNGLIELQRKLIEELAYEGHDITSAQIIFDSLCVSLSLHLQDRHRLRAMPNAKAKPLIGFREAAARRSFYIRNKQGHQPR